MNKQILKGVIFAGLFTLSFVPFLTFSSFFFPFIVTKAFVFRIIVEIIFAAWVPLALLSENYRPKKSIILYSMLGFLTVIGLADLFGVAPVQSFWSNFERMEGFITLLHLGALFLVAGSVFREIDWKRWWNVSLAASGLMALYASLQVIGVIDPSQSGARVDGTFGNTIYLAVYMLFHIFIALFFLWRARANKGLRWIYGLLILLQVFILYHTATRGAILGLIGGLLVTAVLNIKNREDKFIRKGSMTVLIAVLILIGSFAAFRNTQFVRNNSVLSRFASLTTEDIRTQGRYFVWPIAYEGFKEKPLLGWGQDNFNYVFQKHYTPDMFHLEPWFDRAHNIFLDWMVAGGILGILAYLSLYATLLFSIWRRASDTRGEDENFSRAEKSILTGLIAAYFFHNFFVFDHLASYVLFFSLLAYVHSRKNSGGALWQKLVKEKHIKIIMLPALSVLLILSLYFANFLPVSANLSLIGALKARQLGEPALAAKYFVKSYARSPLGRLEITEQIAANSIFILSSNLSIDERNQFFSFASGAVRSVAEEFNDDANTQLIAGSFFTRTGQFDEAHTYFSRAQEFIPGKQAVYFGIGVLYLNQGDYRAALTEFKRAYDMAPEYGEAKMLYLVGAIYAGERGQEQALINELEEREFVFEDRILSAYHDSGRISDVRAILARRAELDPANAENYRQKMELLAN